MGRKARLLIVDDDILSAQTLSDIFSINGYDVDTANSGLEALEEAQINTYDCVLSDIKMERMNGIEILLAIKSIQPHVPFILMTAYSNDDLILKGIRNGALIALTKPLDIERLLDHISRIVNLPLAK